jgi:predicted dehydrogenase
MVADQDATKREHIQQTYPGIETVSDGAEVLNNLDIQAVVIATPISTHYALAKAALKMASTY